jgi:myo-inositol-1(or 4)-monophosphatase
MDEKTLTFAENLAQKTGLSLIHYFNLEGVDADLKDDRTVVTEADLAADTLIRREIQAAYPDDLILTEESNQITLNPERPLWIIDPLDGTTNFSLGLHTWGVSIARLISGYPQTAALYFPLLQELYSAQRGKGAYLNRQLVKINPQRKQNSTSFFACCSRTIRQYDVSLRYKTRILGAAAYDFCSVARGAAIAAFQATPKIWDIAAGWLVLEEAGGTVELYNGESPFPYLPHGTYSNTIYPTMMSANPKVAELLRKSIKKRPAK